MGNASTGCGLGSTAAQVDNTSTRGGGGGSGSSSPKKAPKNNSNSSWGKRSSCDLVPWNPNQRWKITIGKKPLVVTDIRGGRVGLSNLGNTCFMNAALQCLSHLEPVNSYFLSGKYDEEINDRNSDGYQGHLARAFAKLQEELWQKSAKLYRPKSFHSTMLRHCSYLFELYEQQDTQEYLAFFIDGLHEDLNLVKEKPPKKKDNLTEEEELKADEEQETQEKDQGEEYIAAMAWMRHLQISKSVMVDLFQGQFRSTLTCENCEKVNKTFDPYMYMTLPVNDKMRSIEDAIEAFVDEEIMSGDNQWRCPRCKKRVNARKRIDIWKLPQVLVILLKRFEFSFSHGQFAPRKIQASLKCPLTIDLTKWVKSETKEPCVYDITCVANHSGSYGGGHYTAMCRHPIDGKWYNFDDGHVEEVKEPEKNVITNKAYVLFLVRNGQGTSDEDEEVFRQSISHPEVWPHAVSKTNSVMLPAVEDLKKELNAFQQKNCKGKLSASKGLKSLLGGKRTAIPDVPAVPEEEGEEPTL